jgi:bifunctional ADP-heptose synthase (sugar kinase/adenylyltransferase)
MNKVGDLMGKALESYPGLKISHGKPEPVAPTDDSQPTQPADGQDPAQNKPQEVSAMAKHDEILAQCEDLTKELNLVNSLLAKFDAPVTPVEKSETETQPEATSQVVDVAKAAADAVDAKLAPILTALTAMQNDVRAMKSRTASSAVALDGGIRVREVTESPAPRRINGDLNEYFAKLDAEKAKGR